MSVRVCECVSAVTYWYQFILTHCVSAQPHSNELLNSFFDTIKTEDDGYCYIYGFPPQLLAAAHSYGSV